MYPIPSSEHLVETKTCHHCGTSFPITDKDLEFYEKVSPTFGGEKYQIPTPTLCPDCRQQRRLSFRNERKLYKRKCDATEKDIVSIYSPDKPYTVYHQDYWWSDAWNPMEYGKEFDFSRPFFEQFRELMMEVPRPSVLNANCENSEYINYSSYLKNAYLVFDTVGGEDVLYGNNGEYVSQSVDFSDARQCKECYDILDCSNCYNLSFGWGCFESNNSKYVVDIKHCSFCFLSHTIRNNSYFFENVQYSKEEYLKKVREFEQLPREKKGERIRRWEKSFKEKKIYPYHLSISFENSYGSGLLNVKNATSCYSIQESEDIKYCSNSGNLKDCYDVESIVGGSLGYEVNAALEMSNICFGFGNGGNHFYYSEHCLGSSHLFACIGLRNAQYCILNRQYTKEQYEELVPRIIEHMMKTGEWGEFFPSSLSPFGYNETVAQEYFPLTKSEATKGGVFNWSDYEAPFPKVEKIIPANKLPDDIVDIPDDILNWAIECEVTQKPFRIIKQELEFYRKHHLPIPRRHPDQRHLDRMALRNPRKLFERKCDKCGKEIITTYAPERKEIVYCEECYNREVIG